MPAAERVPMRQVREIIRLKFSTSGNWRELFCAGPARSARIWKRRPNQLFRWLDISMEETFSTRKASWFTRAAASTAEAIAIGEKPRCRRFCSPEEPTPN
jgi:hypothetical protein